MMLTYAYIVACNYKNKRAMLCTFRDGQTVSITPIKRRFNKDICLEDYTTSINKALVHVCTGTDETFRILKYLDNNKHYTLYPARIRRIWQDLLEEINNGN